MASPKRCPGCRYSIKNTQRWCTPCEKRAPEHLRESLHQHQKTLNTAVEAVEAWIVQHPPVSPLEMRIIRGLAVGQDTAQLAAQTDLTEAQVREQIRQVGDRWGCRGRTQLVMAAVRLGYLKVEVNA